MHRGVWMFAALLPACGQRQHLPAAIESVATFTEVADVEGSGGDVRGWTLLTWSLDRQIQA